MDTKNGPSCKAAWVCAHRAVGVWGTEEERSHPSGWNGSGSDLQSLNSGPQGLKNRRFGFQFYLS